MAEHQAIDLTLPYGQQHIAYVDRPGDAATVLFIHGLGNAAANFADMLHAAPLADHRLLALDLPGCGASPYPKGVHLDVDRVVDVVEAFVDALSPARFLLVGASLGGLVALLYAERHPERLTGFLNVEGNVASEDCMFSRLVIPHTFDTFEREVLPHIKAAVAAKPGRGFAEHLKVLQRADPRAYYDYSFQTVQYSDHGRLLDRFLGLGVPVHFVYGAANAGLSYLPRLKASRCRVTEIPGADHFLFYDDPAAFATVVAAAVPA